MRIKYELYTHEYHINMRACNMYEKKEEILLSPVTKAPRNVIRYNYK